MLHVSIKTRLGAGEKKSDKGANGQTERSFLLDVEFVVPDGVTILFGPSGAGKTTCLRAIAGIVTPDEGCIRLGERVFFDSVAGVNLPMQQRRVGYVFQDYLLFPHLTAEQNVAYGLRASKHTDKHARIRALLTQLGIEYAAQQYPHELSGGEAQRVAIARALASEPEVFLMDEPLSAVDAQTRERILAEIGSLQKQTGIPFLYVTHNTHEARTIGTHLITMANGQITQSDLTALS